MRVRDTVRLSAALSAALLFAACGGEKEGDKSPEKAPAAKAHEHPPAPHKGEVVELGEEEGHLEMIHDHVAGTVVVYVLDKDLKTPVAVAPPKILMMGADGKNVEFTLKAVKPKPDGTADEFEGGHEAMKSDPWNGRIVLTYKGKEYRAPLEPADHAHDHK